jgi:hypothetical protein
LDKIAAKGKHGIRMDKIAAKGKHGIRMDKIAAKGCSNALEWSRLQLRAAARY